MTTTPDKVVGSITLKAAHVFTKYSEYAAWTEYVECQPQTVELRLWNGFVCASFDGLISKSTYPSGHKDVGSHSVAGVQVTRFGGIGDLMDNPLFNVEITASDMVLEKVGTYSDDCGRASGKPILALVPVA